MEWITLIFLFQPHLSRSVRSPNRKQWHFGNTQFVMVRRQGQRISGQWVLWDVPGIQELRPKVVQDGTTTELAASDGHLKALWCVWGVKAGLVSLAAVFATIVHHGTNQVQPFTEAVFSDRLFQQDNTPCHITKIGQELGEHGTEFKVLIWNPNS